MMLRILTTHLLIPSIHHIRRQNGGFNLKKRKTITRPTIDRVAQLPPPSLSVVQLRLRNASLASSFLRVCTMMAPKKTHPNLIITKISGLAPK